MFLLWQESFISTGKKKFQSSVWRVVLLCHFLVLAGNRFWLYILLCTWSTIQLWCCVSYFVSGGKSFFKLRTYLVYNTDCYYDRKKKVLVEKKKSSSPLSGRCAIVITTGKKVLVVIFMRN